MLHSRLRPLPRRSQATATTASTTTTAPVPTPDFKDKVTNEADDVDEDPEDLFGAFIFHMFPDDAPQFHGNPGQHLLYTSPSYDNLEIMVPDYPLEEKKKSTTDEATTEKKSDVNRTGQVEEARKLFAHFVWSAAMIVAEGIEYAHNYETDPTPAKKEAYKIWNVTDQTVLELGSGAALPSLISVLANASHVVATDHPSSPALKGAIQFNMDHNLTNRSPRPPSTIGIEPHEWGVLNDPFSLKNKGAFTRIIAADCYWMQGQHENITRSMQWFLAPGGHVWVVAGLHTGRKIVAEFFETAIKNGFKIDRIFERDVISHNEDGSEIRREWMPERADEGPENRRRWCVVSVLKRDE